MFASAGDYWVTKDPVYLEIEDKENTNTDIGFPVHISETFPLADIQDSTGRVIYTSSVSGFDASIESLVNYEFVITPTVSKESATINVEMKNKWGESAGWKLYPYYCSGDSGDLEEHDEYNSYTCAAEEGLSDGDTCTITLDTTKTYSTYYVLKDSYGTFQALLTGVILPAYSSETKSQVMISGITVPGGTYNKSPVSCQGTAAVTSQETGINITDEVKLDFIYSGTKGTTYGPSPTAPTHAGNYILTVSVSEDNESYTGSREYPFEIKKAPVTITAKDVQVSTGDAIPGEYEYDVSGLLEGDSLMTVPLLSCAITSTDNAGTYDIIPSGADAGTDYEISYQKGTLTVRVSQLTYSVTFDICGHGAAPEAYTSIIAGSKIGEPPTPTASGYTFTGWYKEAACENLWNFGTDIVTENITLYAGWGIDEAFEGVFEEDTKYAEKGLWVAPVDSYEYTGKAIKPVVRVYYGDRKLDLGIDYTVSYKNNTKAATDSSAKPPTITVKGKGIYVKERIDPVKFTICPVELSDSKISAEDIELIANNKVQKKIPVLTYNGKKLANKKDFILPDDYKGYSEGEHDLVLTAKEGGNFTGTRTVHISIRTGTSMSKVKIGKIDNCPYTGAEIMPTPAVTMQGVPLKESNYTFQYLNNVEIGTATVIVTGKGDYVGTKKVTFKITGDSLKKATITGIGNGENIYDGSVHRPVEVKLNGMTLTENEDYMASYTNNKNAGKASVTITGMGKYTGTIKKTFKIAAYELKKDDSRIGGLEEGLIVPYAGKKGSKPTLNLTFDGKVLREGRDYTLTCKNNKAVTTDDVKKKPTVTIKGKGNFKGKISDIPFVIIE